jgi:UTP pyrophosphatase
MVPDDARKYLSIYPADLVDKVVRLMETNRLGAMLEQKYPTAHDIRTDKALYAFVMGLKKQYMKQSANISRICFDDRISALENALGQHRFKSRVQGSKLRASSEIRIASVFKRAPLPFLKMISVHELAHLREKEHNRAFYRLCEHMEPDYHTLEFDMRLFLMHTAVHGSMYD